MDDELKQCSHCQMNKQISEFNRDRTKSDGFRTTCKDCRRASAGWNKRIQHPDGNKICSKCHIVKPATTENFGVCAKGALGLSGMCKPCLIEYGTARRRQKGVLPKTYLNLDCTGNLECSKCHKLKPATAQFFGKNGNTRLGIGSTCKDCINDDYIMRHDGVRKKSAPRIITSDNTVQCAGCHEFKPATPEFFYRNSIKRLGLNPLCKVCLSMRKYTAKYQAAKRALPNAFTSDAWMFALNYFGHCCAVCGRPQGLWHVLSADHWIPLTSPDCTGTVPSNIVPLCHGIAGCNNSKSNKNPQEWLRAKFSPHRAKQILARINVYFETLRP